MEVTGTTDVGMHYRRPVRGGCGPFGIELLLQDRVDRGVGTCADLKRPAAGRLQPLPAKTLGQADDADRGAEALLGVRALADDDLDQRRGIAPDLAGLSADTLRRPIGIAPVTARHVLTHGGVAPVG